MNKKCQIFFFWRNQRLSKMLCPHLNKYVIYAAFLPLAFLLACAAVGMKEFAIYNQIHQQKLIYGPDDTITFESKIGWHKGSTLTFKIMKGAATIYKQESLITRNRPSWEYSFNIAASELIRKGGSGIYMVFWFIDGVQIDGERIQLTGPVYTARVGNKKPKDDFYISSFQDTKAGEYPKERDSFSKSELPEVIIIGYKSKLINIKVYSISSKKLIFEDNSYVPEQSNTYLHIQINNLTPDSYKVDCTVEGIVVKTVFFTVFN